jgi:hypothetical protein
MAKVTHHLAVCSECLYAAAYGTSEMDLTVEREAEIKRGFQHLAIADVQWVPGDGEFGFKWSACEMCNQSSAAGDRYELVGLSD